MSAAIALMLLAEAATSCTPARGVALPGGATIIRPVGTSEPVPFEALGPAPRLSRPHTIQQAAAPAEPGDTADEPPSEQCEVLPLRIM
jgi:hypothetical protein